MKYIEFIFELLKKFIKLEDGRYEELKDKAFKWQNEYTDKDNAISKVVKTGDLWYVQILMCFVYLFAVKGISEWMVSTPDPNIRNYEDDEEDEPIFSRRSNKFRVN